MRQPSQPAPEIFLPQFFGALFGSADRLRVSQLQFGADDKPSMSNYSVLRDDAVRWLLDNRSRGVANLYFAAGVHNGAATYMKSDFTSLPALFVDMDAGEGKPFRDIDDIVAFLTTHPVQRATAAWVSGNGVQMMFRFHEPLPFVAGTPEAIRIMDVWKKINGAFIADSCDGPQHLFRVPTTLNFKPKRGSKQGYLLWCDWNRVWTLDELEQAALPWIEPEPEAEAAGEPLQVSAEGEVVPYDQLPEDVREQIEGEHINRSEAMYTCIAKLASAGYGAPTIQSAIAHGAAFRKKYGRRLAEEVDRCIRKITQSPWRTQSGRFVPLPVRSNVKNIRLAECTPLPASVADKIGEYEKIAGIELKPWVRDTARFHEHVVTTNKQGVLLAPCGSGKSTWSLSRIATHASESTRHIQVVETVRQIYTAAEMLKHLTKVPVGCVHAFNEEKCEELCGEKHSWKQCSPKNPRSVCHACEARSDCAFYRREAEEAKPILVMTHAGFIRAVESNSPLLQGAHVIVDEHLDVFAEFEISAEDLNVLQTYNAMPLDWSALFPHSRQDRAFSMWNVNKQARSFAARNYVYREHATGGLADLYADLRRMMVMGLQPNDAFEEEDGDRERAYETITKLLNILRSSDAGDAAYAYIESLDEYGHWCFRIRKLRFSLGTEQPWASMWILNASAQLCPVEYPASLPVFTCSDIPDSSHLLRLLVVCASPTAKKLDRQLLLTHVANSLSEQRGRHRSVLITTSKKEAGLLQLENEMAGVWEPGMSPDAVRMTRGRIRGSNEAGTCTLAILSTMPLFTQANSYALQAALLLKRSLPQSSVFDPKTSKLKMSGGKFALPAMQACYALGSLDELYQSAWRAAVRNGRPTEIVVTIPDVSWMRALWETVMPRAQVVSAISVAGKKETALWREKLTKNLALMEAQAQVPGMAEHIANQRAALDAPDVVVADQQILGMQSVINMAAGTRITKNELAGLLGYGGAEPWKENRKLILAMVSPWLAEADDNVQQMVRVAEAR